ncbi:MAG: type II toxin-antitoxin system prevent-host-death family antitoxin [Starkeya sp.]|nr:type II toxin-antitoxin system prevent-host-death family antitoxin [Starkeya sp.]
MNARIVPAAQFKAECLRLIEEMNETGVPLTITRRGKPVAVLSPVPAAPVRPLIGAARGVVTRYDDPFAPATDEGDWAASS